MNCRIRFATDADAPALAATYAPSVAGAATSFELDPPDASEMSRRRAKVAARFPWLVFDAERAVLGYAYASTHRERPAYLWTVEVSIYLDERIHRAGIGKALYTALFALLARQGIKNALAGIVLPNAASVRLHESMGFSPAAVYRGLGYKRGAWHDVGWWQRELAPRDPMPVPPLRIAEVPAEVVAEALRAGESLLDQPRVAEALARAGI
jgi:L-amino acid N-acyltransferase YncA